MNQWYRKLSLHGKNTKKENKSSKSLRQWNYPCTFGKKLCLQKYSVKRDLRKPRKVTDNWPSQRQLEVSKIRERIENFEKHWNQSSQFTEQMMLGSSNVACKQERLKQFT